MFSVVGGVAFELYPRNNSRVPHIPDFLCSFVGSLNFMRLSLKRGAHAVLSRAAYRKFGASRSFFARCGIPQAFPQTSWRTSQLRTGALRSHQRCPDFLLRSTNHERVCGFLSKKAACSCSKPPISTGNPGYVGRKRWAKPTIAFSSELYHLSLRRPGFLLA
jgi:hypothetical protein